MENNVILIGRYLINMDQVAYFRLSPSVIEIKFNGDSRAQTLLIGTEDIGPTYDSLEEVILRIKKILSLETE